MAKFIGETGLVYLWAKIKAWVGNYAKITETSGNKSLTVGNTTATLPTKTSQLTNDSDFVTSADIPEGAAASTTTPKMDGTAAVGTETKFARGDHRHPSDTSKQDVISDLATIRSNASAGAAKVSNVQADWNASTGLAVILNKPTIPAEVTESTVAGWGFTKNTGTYSKPSTGIPKTDLATSVQTSLGLADTALQSFTESDPVFTASAAHGISSTDISNWNAKGTYSKPSGGIPKTDLASAVQTSLGKADTALQSYTETDPVFAASVAADITSSDITNWNSKTSNIGTITGINMNGASKGTSGVVDLGTVITAHQDISGKADKSTTYTKTEVDGIVDDYLPLSGGTMTGSLNVATGSGISDASGNGLIVYHPTTWTGITSSQWGVGAIDSRAIVRSSDGEVLHYCGGNGKTFNMPDSLRYTLASGASTTTDISINGGYYGKTFFAIVSGHSGSGNSTMSGVYMIRCGYSGNNFSVNRISINAAGSTTVTTEPCQFTQSDGYLRISAVGYNIVVRLLCNRDFY